MSSPGQRRGGCGHAMANFDSHAFCARCREKGKGTDDCVKKPQSSNCKICNAFSEEQRLQLATPSYRIKKEKREAKKLETTPIKDTEALVDPASVSVIGPIDKPTPAKPALEAPPPDKKIKKDTKKVGKKDKSPSATVSKPPSADDKIADLDSKWAERFNRLEALLLSKNFEPQFSANVKVTPTHSPPASVERVSDPFIRPSSSSAALPGTGFSAEKHQPTSKALTGQQSSSSKFPGTGPLLISISRPVKLKPADLLHLPPPTDIPRLEILVPTQHLSLNRAVTDQPQTDQCPLIRQIQALRPYIGPDRTVSQASLPMMVVNCRTGLPWIYMPTKGNGLRNIR